MLMVLFLLGGCPSKHQPTDEEARQNGCDAGTTCGALAGEDDGAACLSADDHGYSGACTYESICLTKSDVGMPDCPREQYQAFKECYADAYDRAWSAARAEAGCDDTGGASG